MCVCVCVCVILNAYFSVVWFGSHSNRREEAESTGNVGPG